MRWLRNGQNLSTKARHGNNAGVVILNQLMDYVRDAYVKVR